MKKSKIFDEMDYVSRISNIVLFTHNLLKHGLDSNSSDKMVSDLTRGLDDILMNPKIYKNGKIPGIKDVDKIYQRIYRKNYYTVVNYKRWILNHSVLMMCGIYECFLKDLLSEVLEENQSLCLWNNKKDILSDFKESGIKGKYNVYLNKLKIKEEEFFDFSYFDDQTREKYASFGFNDLEEIFKKRNKIAHGDSYIIKSIKEVDYINDVFQKIIINISSKVHKKWKIKTRLVEAVLRLREKKESKKSKK